MAKPILRSRRGDIETGTAFIRDLLLVMMLMGTTVYLVSGNVAGNLVADDTVRDIGALFDSLSLTPKHMEIYDTCPSSYTITVEGNRITAEKGSTKVFYFYISPKNAKLPDIEVDCADYSLFKITKDIDPDTEITTIMFEGV